MSESGSVPRTMLSGSALFFLSATIVNIGNYLFNLLLGRWLGPVAFADLSLIITLFLMLSFLTAGLQTPAARFAAIFAADKDASTTAAMRRGLQRAALVIGGVISVTFVAGAPVWKDFFSTASLWPFVIFGLFVPFYLLQGIDRGVLQGRLHFRWLALTYQSEMWSRLILGLLFVAIGWSVNGAVFGLGLSFIVTWLVASRVRRDLPPGATMQKDTHQQLLSYVGPVMIAQAGQILINNSDIIIVRHFFAAESAGQYAALALIGRIVFFATWSVVTTMFPIVAQRHRRGERHRSLFYLSMGIVILISLGLIGFMWLWPGFVVTILFGTAYVSVAPLLWQYCLATALFALSNVVIQYNLSINRRGGTYLAIAFSLVQVVTLWLVHDTLAQVVLVQIVLMGAMLAVLLTWDILQLRLHGKKSQSILSPISNDRE